MVEVLDHLRANQFETFIVTGGGQDFVRNYAQRVYGIPTQKVIGSSIATKYEVTDSQRNLMRLPKLFFDDNDDGKAIGIELFIGKRPYAAFGNSTGDREMLAWTGAGSGARLKMLVYHDDAEREYAYGPAGGLPDTKVGTFTQALYDEAMKDRWTVISMKNDWKHLAVRAVEQLHSRIQLGRRGSRLSMLVLHDDAVREYGYGPAQGLADSKVGTFTQALYDEATRNGWTVISMKSDWKRIFSFEP